MEFYCFLFKVIYILIIIILLLNWYSKIINFNNLKLILFYIFLNDNDVVLSIKNLCKE